jgi:NADH-quinone oxidoreductase chain I
MSWITDLLGPFKGFAVTMRQVGKPRVTRKYPKEKRIKPERFHGRHVLNRYPDGMEKCIGCELCAGVCPANCIYVRGADNPPDAPVSPGERFGFVYEINMLRCIFCAMCVEACPTQAITMTHLFEMSVTDRDDAIYTKDELTVDRPRRTAAGGRMDASHVTIGPGRVRGCRRLGAVREDRRPPAGEGPVRGRLGSGPCPGRGGGRRRCRRRRCRGGCGWLR